MTLKETCIYEKKKKRYMFSMRGKERREFVPNLAGVRRLTFDMEIALQKRHCLFKRRDSNLAGIRR